MRADNFIERSLRRAALHARFLELLEGGLLLAVVAGAALFAGVVLDHIFSLSIAGRMALFALVVAAVVVALGHLLLPLVRRISPLYLARRLESMFPHFKSSLITFIELFRRRRGELGALIARDAARGLQGVDVDAALDARRFVRLGYVFVALVLSLFAYSVLGHKSVFTSFKRIIAPWASIAAPTRARIEEVSPGDARIVRGSPLEVSAVIKGAVPEAASVRWSRDGEIWRSVPLSPGPERWNGRLDHVETDIYYRLSAGDALSRRFEVTALTPPVVERVSAQLEYPDYTGLEDRTLEEANLKAPVGTRVSLRIESNKELRSASLELPGGETAGLRVAGRSAAGHFTVETSGRYLVKVEDEDGLAPELPVEYDLVAVPDRPPQVSLEGPEEGAVVALQDELPFVFEASDDYGLERMAFHFQTYEGDADVKEFLLPAGRTGAVRKAALVPELLGARPGETVTCYLAATDNRPDRPQSARTPARTFKVAEEGSPLLTSPRGEGGPEPERAERDVLGAESPSSGKPERHETARSERFRSSRTGGPEPSEDARARLLEMLQSDREAWEKIQRHFSRSGSEPETPAGRPSPSRQDRREAAAETPREAETGTAERRPPPGERTGSAEQTARATEAGTAEPSGAPSGSEPAPRRAEDGAPQKADSAASGATGGAAAGAEKPPSAAAGASPAQKAPASTAARADATPTGAAGAGGESGAEPRGAGKQAAGAAEAGRSTGAPAGEEGAGGAPGEGQRAQAQPGAGESAASAAESASASEGAGEGGRGTSASGRSAGSTGEAGGDSESAAPSEGVSGRAPAAGDAAGGAASASGSAAGPAGQAASTSGAESPSGTAAEQPAGETGPVGGPGRGESGESSGEGVGEGGAGEPGEAAGASGEAGAGASGKSSEGRREGQAASASAEGPTGSGSRDGAAGRSPAASASARGGGPGGGGVARGPEGPVYTPTEVEEAGPVEEEAEPGPARVEEARRLVERLSGQLETRRVDSELLTDLGWEPATLRTFVSRYRDIFGEVEELADEEGEFDLRRSLEAGMIRRGERGEAAVGEAGGEGPSAGAAGDGALKELGRESISPEYREAVREYFKALAEQSSGRGG